MAEEGDGKTLAAQVCRTRMLELLLRRASSKRSRPGAELWLARGHCHMEQARCAAAAEAAAKAPPPGGFRAGVRVACRYGGGSAEFSGAVGVAHADGSCDVAYDDGDAESGVAPALVRPLPSLAAGARVRCRYGGGAVAFPGAIAVAHASGKYDIAYDDGDAEQGVGAELVISEELALATTPNSKQSTAQARADYACAVALQPKWADACQSLAGSPGEVL